MDNHSMKKIIALLFVLMSGPSLAQSQLAPGQIMGNPTVAKALPSPTDIGSVLTRWGVPLPGSVGGTGVNNGSRTITIGGNFSASSSVSITGAFSTAAAVTHAGAFATTLTALGVTNATFPAGTHTLAGLDVTQVWSASQSYANGSFILNGATSGGLTLGCVAVCGFSSILLPAGATNFGSTGGTGQFVKQATAGGPLTVSAPIVSELSGFGTGVATALGVNVGTAGAPVINGGALGTPSSGSAANLTGLPAGTGLTGQTPIANGGTGQSTAPAARASTGLNVDSFTGRGDAAYTILVTDRTVGTNAAFTASRTWTLPAANAVNAGQEIIVSDFQGTVTASNSLVIARAGSDTVNGGTSVTITAANGAYLLKSDGISKWTAQALGAAAAGGVSSVTCGTGMTGGTITTSGTCNVSLIANFNVLGSDVPMTTLNTFVDGPSVAQGTTGTWYASGTATVYDSALAGVMICKLWDGTTTIASARNNSPVAQGVVSISLSGYISGPAGNIRISCKDSNGTNGVISANVSLSGRDSMVTVLRIQ
jgi:hypothetical protein